MELTIAQVMVMKEGLEKLAGASLPLKLSYRLAGFIDDVNAIYERVEKTRQSLINELGEEIEGGGIQVKEENLSEFATQMTELMNEKEEFKFEGFTIEELGNIELSAADFMKIKPMIKDEE